MSKSTPLLIISSLILVITITQISVSATVSDFTWLHSEASDLGININIIDDLDGMKDMEFGMSSESTRRMLANNQRYISYGALSKNNVPCSRRGASYYNCRSGGQANPYTRGCSAITRCRR